MTGHQILKDITVVESNYTEYGLVVKYKKIVKEFSQVSLYGKDNLHTELSLSCGSPYSYIYSSHYQKSMFFSLFPTLFFLRSLTNTEKRIGGEI